MARWKWFPSDRSAGGAQSRLAVSAATTAFLAMDQRQSHLQSAVKAVDDFHPEQHLGREWGPLEDLCYRAAGAYVELVERVESGTTPAPGQNDHVLGLLHHATGLLDQFYEFHRNRLDRALFEAGSVVGLIADAHTAAETARAAVPAEYADFPSVVRASTALDQAEADLRAATSPRRQTELARDTRAAAAALSAAAAAAPGRAAEAQRALASVRHRVEASRNKAQQADEAFSALLREFQVNCSRDLTGNGTAGKHALEDASRHIEQARIALDEAHPERALELISEARRKLAEAETKFTEVTSRLAILRQVRENPNDRLSKTRFRLRDAQLLVVNRRLTKQWASVLDAQALRIDRAAAALTGRNPDYWEYVKALDLIDKFIGGVVERVRKESSSPDHR